MIQNVSVIGLGKLGASMLAGMASRGVHVIGVDITWRCLEPSVTNHPKINYVPLGRCLDDAPAASVLEAIWGAAHVEPGLPK